MSNRPNSGATVDMMVEGWEKSSVPIFSFCNISRSLPSWLLSNTVTCTLPAICSLTRRANSVAEIDWFPDAGVVLPSLSSITSARAGAITPAAAATSTDMISAIFSFIASSLCFFLSSQF
jgi:hypothetical protein